MEEREYELAGGSLYYEIKKEREIAIRRFHGMGSEVTVPAVIEGLPVTVIDRKSFLSSKTLQRVTLPDTLEELGDWAFAYCDSLQEVVLPKKPLRFGKALFLECGRLERIVFRAPKQDGEERVLSGVAKQDDEIQEQTAYLTAAALTTFEAYYLLDAMEAGSREWLAKWDAALQRFLHADDYEGYAKQILCGEEDYGSTDVEAFLNGKRRRKARLLYLRLLNPVGLADSLKEEAEQYLREHTKGCAGEEAWEIIRKERGNDRAYYRLFTEIGCLTQDNLEALLEDIGEEYPEMKAFFLRWKEEHLGTEDFFGGLSLDL